MYTSVIHIKLVDKSTYRLSQSPSLLISGSGSWAQRDGLLSQAVFRFRFIACIQIQRFSGRFIFLHLSTLPRWDFLGSHGAKNITDLLYFERAHYKVFLFCFLFFHGVCKPCNEPEKSGDWTHKYHKTALLFCIEHSLFTLFTFSYRNFFRYLFVLTYFDSLRRHTHATRHTQQRRK